MNSESVFRYSYSAKQNEEVQAIRDKYLPREETKLEELKRLGYEVSSAGLPVSKAQKAPWRKRKFLPPIFEN